MVLTEGAESPENVPIPKRTTQRTDRCLVLSQVKRVMLAVPCDIQGGVGSDSVVEPPRMVNEKLLGLTVPASNGTTAVVFVEAP